MLAGLSFFADVLTHNRFLNCSSRSERDPTVRKQSSRASPELMKGWFDATELCPRRALLFVTLAFRMAQADKDLTRFYTLFLFSLICYPHSNWRLAWRSFRVAAKRSLLCKLRCFF